MSSPVSENYERDGHGAEPESLPALQQVSPTHLNRIVRLSSQIRVGAALSVSLIGVTGCANPTQVGSSAAEDITDPAYVGQFIGSGVNDVSGAVLVGCVQRSEMTAGDGAPDIDLKVEYFTSLDSLATALNLSASAKLGVGKLSASARIDRIRNTDLSSFRSYVVATVSVVGAPVSIISPEASDRAIRAAKKGDGQFFRECGTRFVRGVRRGGTLFGVIEVMGNTSWERDSAYRTFKASYFGIGGGSLSRADVEKRLQKHSYSTAHIFRTGGASLKNLTPMALIDYALNFEDSVKTSIKNSQAVRIDWGDYTLVKGVPKLDLGQQLKTIDSLASRRMKLDSIANDAKFILGSTTLFTPEERDSAAVVERLAKEESRRLVVAGNECVARELKRCDPLPAPLELRLPVDPAEYADPFLRDRFVIHDKGVVEARPVKRGSDWQWERTPVDKSWYPDTVPILKHQPIGNSSHIHGLRLREHEDVGIGFQDAVITCDTRERGCDAPSCPRGTLCRAFRESPRLVRKIMEDPTYGKKPRVRVRVPAGNGVFQYLEVRRRGSLLLLRVTDR